MHAIGKTELALERPIGDAAMQVLVAFLAPSTVMHSGRR